MELGFLSQKGNGRGRGVKEKDTNDSNLEVVKDGVVPSVTVASGDTQVKNMRLSSFGPSLPTQDITSASNAPGMSSYANVTGKPSGTKVDFCTLFTPGGNGIDVVVPVESIRAISERFINTAYGFFLGKRVAYLVVAKSSYARAMIELRADVELKDNIVVAMPKINGEGHYTCNIRVEYECKPPRCASCKVFGHTHEDCPKNIGAGVMKNLKKTSQAPKGMDYTNKVSDSNPFEVINLVDNDVEMGTNRGTLNLDNNETNSSGSSFWNVENSSTSTTSIMEKIKKFENLIIDGQAILVDEAGNPLTKVEYSGDHDSEDEVASVDNDMACSLASEKTGFGTQSLPKQWRDSYGNDDYDEVPYDDDMYEGQDLSEEIQTICDKLDNRVRGRKKQ
ncbi:hypothetical protein Tco_0278456 [Tanacetum coccineum]